MEKKFIMKDGLKIQMNKIFNSLKYRFARFLIYLGYILNSSSIIYYGYDLLVYFLGNGKEAILVFAKDEFHFDLKVLSQNTDRFTFIVLEVGHLKRLQNFYLKKITPSVDDYFSEKYKKDVKKYSEMLKLITLRFKKNYKFSKLVTCNFVYSALRPMPKICKENRIYFIIIYKEGLILTLNDEQISDYSFYFKKFIYGSSLIECDKLLVTNNYIKNTLIRVSNNKFTNKNLIVCGLPRFDNLTNLKNNEYKIITIFELDPINSCYKFDSRNFKFDQYFINKQIKLTKFYYDEILKFIINNPNEKFIFKTKKTIKNSKLKNYFINNLNSNNIENVTFPNLNSIEIIKQSKMIISLPSTVVIEAIYLNKKVLTPNFSKLFKHDKWTFFYNYKNLNFLFNSHQDLEKALNNKINFENKYSFLKKFTNFDKNENFSAKVSSEI